MAGELDHLFYVLVEVLNAAKAPASLSAVAPLLADPNPSVGERAGRFLLALGDDPAHRDAVKAVTFPAGVLARLRELPAWLGQAPPPTPADPVPEPPADDRLRSAAPADDSLRPSRARE